MRLIKPSLDTLPGFVDALGRGWSPDNIRGAEAAREQLDAIERDSAAFIARLDDVEARGGPVKLPDGSLVQRLPGFHRWLWDGAFCGTIGFRWQHGTSELPSHVLGHIGYAVVPWKRGRGYATQALALTLPSARSYGLTYVELITDPDNIASQKVIEACGGKLLGLFKEPEAYGRKESLRYRIEL